MAKKQEPKFNPQGFSLIVKYDDKKEVVEIPYKKQNYDRETVGGKQTYQMAIDAFTIKFKDKDELLNYIRNNDMANIKDIPNEDITVSMEYNGENDYGGNRDIVYNDNKELLFFIKTNLIKENYEFSFKVFGKWQQEITDRLKKDLNYCIFMTNSNNFYGWDMIITIGKVLKAKAYDTDFVLKPISRYHNLRGHLIGKQSGQIDLEVRKIAYNNLPFDEQSKKENVEKLREIKAEEKKLEKNNKPIRRKKKLKKENDFNQMQISFEEEIEETTNYKHPHSPYRY